MRHTPAAGRSARRGGGCASLSYPQRRANGRGHAALLAQSLDNRCAVTHMPTPEGLRRAPLVVSPDTLIPNSRATGGLMVAVTAWPNGRGERHALAEPPAGIERVRMITSELAIELFYQIRIRLIGLVDKRCQRCRRWIAINDAVHRFTGGRAGGVLPLAVLTRHRD